jgi:hypothetical protein
LLALYTRRDALTRDDGAGSGHGVGASLEVSCCARSRHIVAPPPPRAVRLRGCAATRPRGAAGRALSSIPRSGLRPPPVLPNTTLLPTALQVLRPLRSRFGRNHFGTRESRANCTAGMILSMHSRCLSVSYRYNVSGYCRYDPHLPSNLPHTARAVRGTPARTSMHPYRSISSDLYNPRGPLAMCCHAILGELCIEIRLRLTARIHVYERRNGVPSIQILEEKVE